MGYRNDRTSNWYITKPFCKLVKAIHETQMSNQKQAKDEMYEDHPYGVQSVLDELENPKKYKDKRILIAGCGAGSRLFDMYFHDANITAIDQSENAIEFIRSQFIEMDYEPPELIAGDLLNVELPSDEFDYILCYGVLHHTTNPETILTKFNKWLKGSGEVELLLYHRNSFVRIEREVVEKLNNILNIGQLLPTDFKQRIEWWDKYENPVWETYTKDEAEQMVKEAGFKIDELWLSNTPFGQFTNWILPPIIRKPLESLFDGYKWHIRIRATIK